jgi:hypothetical protein
MISLDGAQRIDRQYRGQAADGEVEANGHGMRWREVVLRCNGGRATALGCPCAV